MIPVNIKINFTSPETRKIVLSDSENRTIVSSLVWTKHLYMYVADGQTDGRTDEQTDRIPVAIIRPHCSQFCIASNGDAL